MVFSFSQLVFSAGYSIYQMSNHLKCPTGHLLSRVCISRDCSYPPSLCSADQCLCSSTHSVCTKLPISDLREAVLVKKMLASHHSNANIARIVTSLNALRKLCSEMLINIYEFAPSLLMTAGENTLAEIIEHHRWDVLDRGVLIGVKTSLDTIAKVEDLTFAFKRMAQKYNILDRRVCRLETILLHINNEMSDHTSISSHSEESIGCFASTLRIYRQSTPVDGSQEHSVDHQEAIEEVSEMTSSMETFAVAERVQLITYRPASFEISPLRLDSIRRQQETIKSLDFRCTDLNGTHLAQVIDGCRWPFLLSIDCSNTNINDSCSEILQRLTVRDIRLGGNYLTDRLLTGLEPLLNTLFILNLSFTYLTDAGVEVLSKELSCCVSLDISYTKVTQKGLACLVGLSQLKELHVWGGWKTLPRFHQYKFYNRANTIVKQQHHRCEFNASSLSQLKGKFQLRRWSISLSNIDSDWVLANVDKEEVQTLHVAGGTPPKSYLQFMLKCQTLKEVYIECCDLTNRKFRSDKFVSVCLVRCIIDSYILDRCQSQHMRVLDLRYSTSQSMDSVVAGISTLGLLRQLYLAQCAVSDQHLSCLCQRLQDLEVLDVSLTRVTNRGVSSLATCRQLQTLNISNLRIDDQSIAGLSNCLLKLRSLFIMQTNVSDLSIPTVLGMPSLQNIWVGYSRLTQGGISHLKLSLRVFQ